MDGSKYQSILAQNLQDFKKKKISEYLHFGLTQLGPRSKFYQQPVEWQSRLEGIVE